jgi:steroid delta-isomerase-like uncharacterized protein
MLGSFPICYETAGDPANPCILLIAGIGAQLLNWPKPFIQSLVDNGFHVVSYDNRDAGLSKHYDEYGAPSIQDLLQGKLPEKFYTLNDMANDARLLLDELKISAAHIVGISMGGMIAQLVAINYPLRVKSLTCIATSSSEKGLPDSSPDVQQFFFSPKRDKASTKADHIKEKAALYKVYNHPVFFDEDEVNGLHEQLYDRNHDPVGFMRQMIAMAVSSPRTQQLKTLDIPALIIHGDYDPVFPIEHGRQLAGAIRESQLIELAKFGHGLPGHFCEIVAKHMIEFYKKIVVSAKAELVKRLLDKVWSEGDLKLINTLIANNYTIYNDALDPLEGKVLDHEAFKKRVIASRQAFPDLHFEIKQLYTTTEGKVVVTWFMQGTNDGDIPGMRASHKKINVPGMTVYYFNNEKISGHWQVFDHLVMFNQLGITHFDPTAH